MFEIGFIQKKSNYSDFVRTQGQGTGQIPDMVAEQKTECPCLRYYKIVPGMEGCVWEPLLRGPEQHLFLKVQFVLWTGGMNNRRECWGW